MEPRLQQIEQRLTALEQASTIPLSLERALKARGFLSGDDFVVGQITLDGGGLAAIPIPNANKHSMGMAFYADAANTGHVDAYIETISTGGYELSIVGTATDTVNYIVFLNIRTIPIIN